MPDLEARCRLLETENEDLRAKVAALEDLLGITFDAPAWLGLSGSEAKVFGVLMAREAATKRLLMDVLYGDKPDGDVAAEKIVDVFVCKLRAKVKAFDIEIETNFGQGWFMTSDMKRHVRALMASQAAAA